jgi:hypothetical protein
MHVAIERVLKFAFGVALGLVLIFFGFAYGLYVVGAGHAPRGWKPTATMYPDNVRRAWWRIETDSEPVEIPTLSPPALLGRWLGLALEIQASRNLPKDPPLHALSRVARLGAAGQRSGDYQLAAWAMTIQASRWPDDRIVDTILDQAILGGDARGLEAGALRVFARPLASLGDDELVLLVHLTAGPMYLDPWCHGDRLGDRMAARSGLTPARIEAVFARLAPEPADSPCR